MPLSEEQREALRQKVAELAEQFDSSCVFRYQQSAELKKIWKYRNSNGVCFAMSLDWLRRKMHNAQVHVGKLKRDFNDPKYAGKSARVRLTRKHAVLQDVYQKSNAQNKFRTTGAHLTAMVAANVVNSGLDHLQVGLANHVHSYELQEGISIGCANTHLEMQKRLADALESAEENLDDEPSVGVVFHMAGSLGHATAFHMTPATTLFFDPNIGEYQFPRVSGRHRTLQFVSLLWFDVYHKYFNMDNLEFETVNYA